MVNALVMLYSYEIFTQIFPEHCRRPEHRFPGSKSESIESVFRFTFFFRMMKRVMSLLRRVQRAAESQDGRT